VSAAAADFNTPKPAGAALAGLAIKPAQPIAATIVKIFQDMNVLLCISLLSSDPMGQLSIAGSVPDAGGEE
jgi:hypothetical protein